MTIIAINGKLRQGKGILATKLALAVADSGGPVLANYSINSPNVTTIDFYDLVGLLTKPKTEKRTLIVLDEIQGWLDSYLGQAKALRFGSYFVFQSAKLGYDLIYTTQLTMRAVNTLRELADYRIYAKKDLATKTFYYFWLDPNISDDDVPTGSGFTITFKHASTWWDRYDTFEAVAPFGLADFLLEIEKHEPERRNETINAQVHAILKSGISCESNKTAVESALLELNLPTSNASIVAYRLGKHRYTNNKPPGQKTSLTTSEQKPQKLRELWKRLGPKKRASTTT